MKRIVVLGLLGVFLISATGCGGPDALVKEFIVHLNAYAETIEKKESKEKQQAAADRANATLEKINKLKLSDEEKAKLIQKHESDLKAATERVNKARKAQLQEGGTGVIPPAGLGDFKIQ